MKVLGVSGKLEKGASFEQAHIFRDHKFSDCFHGLERLQLVLYSDRFDQVLQVTHWQYESCLAGRVARTRDRRQRIHGPVRGLYM